MRRALKAALWGAGGLSALVAGYLLLLCFPGPLFAYHAQVGALTLYDDDPIAPGTAQQVLLDVQRRLDRCPLDAGRPAQSVFLCDREWQHRLLMLSVPKAGGVAYGPVNWNVFLRRADAAHNVLFTRKGAPSGPDRPLAYFIAHEITHNLTERRLGFWAYSRLPVWTREGYADYVGKGGDFDFKKNLALFQQGDPSLDPKATGLYLRYHLMTAYLLDVKRVPLDRFLTGAFPKAGVEGQLRALAL